ncbi:MAG: hypothetical protein P0Y66_04105 [Candidatus Kaistia colombiensis]|nr:MAG: hypothetical protein P0Y66_04105 [Kaistia sp.]
METKHRAAVRRHYPRLTGNVHRAMASSERLPWRQTHCRSDIQDRASIEPSKSRKRSDFLKDQWACRSVRLRH